MISHQDYGSFKHTLHFFHILMLRPYRYLTPPLDTEEELENDRVLEIQARKELEDYGCPPCYPPDLEFPVRNPPEQYQAIVQYWNSYDYVPLCRQKMDWELFCSHQAGARCRNRPFSNFVDEVRERRQRHGLGGDVRLLFNTEQQSQLDNWIEFQNHHLKGLERLEKKRDMVKQGLDDAQKLAGNKNTAPNILGLTPVQMCTMSLEAGEQYVKSHRVLLHWIEQQRLAMDPGHPTPVKEDHEDQNVAPKAVRKTSTRGRRTKQTEGPSVLGKIRVTKAKSKQRNTRNMRTQKLKAPELEPPIQNLDVILQSSTSQASKHPKTKHPGTKSRYTEIDRPLRQIHPQSVSKASRFAGIRVKSPSGPRGSGAEQTQSLDRARRPTPQRAQSALTFTTRSGRISRPPTK